MLQVVVVAVDCILLFDWDILGVVDVVDDCVNASTTDRKHARDAIAGTLFMIAINDIIM